MDGSCFSTSVDYVSIFCVEIHAGAKVAITGDDKDGKSLFAKSLVGLDSPNQGVVRVADLDPCRIAGGPSHQIVGYAGRNEVFAGTVRENVDLGRAGIGQSRVRHAIEAVGLSDVMLQLRKGLQTRLQTGGYPLTDEQVSRLMIARAIVANPKLLVLNGVLDNVSPANLPAILDKLLGSNASWTLIVTTDKSEIAERCDQQISFHQTKQFFQKGSKS